MKRIWATVVKEWHMIRRDVGGLALLFIMPVLLIIIMALVQDAPFKDYKNISYTCLLLNQDQGRVSVSLKQGLSQTHQFVLNERQHNQPLDLALCKQLVQEGQYPMAIIIPKGISAEVVNSANKIANEMGKKFGLPASLPERATRSNQKVQVIFDPTAKPAFKMAITNALDQLITKIQSDLILERISSLKDNGSDTSSFNLAQSLQAIGVEEISAQKQSAHLEKMNSVQHNVPAWAIFGIFFLAVVISESLIAERQSGSWTRMKLIPGSFFEILMGKMMFFIALGILQFGFMLGFGVWVMPLFGLPAMQLGASPLLLIPVTICIASCATCMGICIGTLFGTTKQALPFAALSIVILSAIGGIWVPLEVLPKVLKQISYLSPMRWSLDGVNQLLLRNAGWRGIATPCFILLLISIGFLFSAQWLENRRRY